MQRWNRFYMTCIFLLVIGISGTFIFSTDKTFSSEENRYLASFPKVTWESIRSGAFGKELEQYVADQFPLREYWVTMKAWADISLNKRENHEVYAGKDDYLLQKIPPPKFPLDDQLGYVKQFAEGVNMPVYFMLAPNSAAIHTDKLPNYAPVPEQQITIQQACSQLSDLISCVHLYDTLKDRHDEYIYYRTDHHWTTLGAYYAYETFAKQAGLKPFAQSDFKMERVSESFYGTLYARGNFRHVQPDAVDVWLPYEELSHIVTTVDTGDVTDSLYAWSYLEERDQYPLFLGGNHALMTIETPEAPDRTLLVIKDSYAHSLVPFLTAHYRHIHMADLRYLNTSMQEYARTIEADEVLLLYNVASFEEDQNIIKLRWS